MLVPIDKCPVCFSPKIVPFKKGSLSISDLTPDRIRITDSEFGLTWDLSRCLSCEHVFANPCPSAAFISSLYSRVEDPAYEEEASGRRRNFRRILRRLERLTGEKGLLFDVGAATGLFLHEARKRGWMIAGIEPSGWAVEVAWNKYGIHLHKGAFEELQLEPRSFDVVTMIDVLEHMSRPREMMEKVWQALKPGGLLCVVTPDRKSLAARLAGRRWWHFRPGHLGYFSRETLKKLLDLTAFSILRWRRYSWTFSLPYLFHRMKLFTPLLQIPGVASLWPKISLKLALGDSFEVYARKRERA